MASEFETLWQQVEAIAHPGPAPKPESHATGPSPRAIAYRRLLDVRLVALVLAWTTLLMLPVFSIARWDPSILWAIGAVGFVSVAAVMTIPKNTSSYEEHLRTTEAIWKDVEKDWDKNAGPRPFDAKKLHLRNLWNEWTSLPIREQQELEKLKDTRYGDQLDEFLSGTGIEAANILNIGDGRLNNLLTAKIKTAADIKSQTDLARINGIGPTLAESLIDWRRSLEDQFEFDPSKEVSKARIQRVMERTAADAKDLSRQLATGIEDLRNILARIEKVQSRGVDVLQATYDAYDSARRDALHVGAI